jgi:hypothetical protein
MNRAPPLQLFYYRDGVSDSEFDTVYKQEYQAITGLSISLYNVVLQAQRITLDAYERAGIQKFQCLFLFVTKR